MKIAVIGAGVTGLAAAARIASQGHEVTIFEKYKCRRAYESKRKTALHLIWVHNCHDARCL